MSNPSEQFLFLSSSAPGIFSSILSPSSSDAASVSRENNTNPRKKRSKLTPFGTPLSLDPSNPDRPRKSASRRPDPDAPKITRPCSECGKKFWSWKALFGHMRCHPERQWRGMNPPVTFQPRPPEGPDPLPNLGLGRGLGGPATSMTEADHEVASCLLMLANGQSGEPSHAAAAAAAASNHDRDASGEPISPCLGTADPGYHQQHGGDHHRHLLGRFECSSCKKVFGSHQALGGHRASHKNVKGCFANAMGRSSSLDFSDNFVVADGAKRECEDSGASLTTQLAMNSFATKDACDVDLSLRLGL